MATEIQIRLDTAANWVSVNPVLAQGELAMESDTSSIKIGDGVTTWTSLGYLAGKVAPGNLTGTSGRFVGTSSGSPAAGSYLVGDFTIDPVNKSVHVYTATGWQTITGSGGGGGAGWPTGATEGDLIYYSVSASGSARLGIGSSGTILGSNGTDPVWKTLAAAGIAGLASPSFTGTVTSAGPIQAQSVAAVLTGVSGRFVGVLSAAPTTGTWVAGDYAIDFTNQVIRVCSVGGTPGTWISLGGSTGITWPGGTAEGSMLYYHSGATAQLAAGTTGQILGVNGSGDPAWGSGAVTTTQTANYTLGTNPSDANGVVPISSASQVTVTVPASTFPVGTQIILLQEGLGGIVLAGGSGVTINGVTPGSGALGMVGLNCQYGTLVLQQIATNVWTAVSTRQDPMNVQNPGSGSQAGTILAGYMNLFTLNTAGTTLTLALPPAIAGSSFTVSIYQPASGTSGTYSITGADFGGATAPTGTATLGKADTFVGFCEKNGGSWRVVTVGQAF